jgi:hypothetical protein
MIDAIPIAASSSSSNGLYTLLGAVIGAVIAAAIGYWVAKRARESAEKVAELTRVSAEKVAELTRVSAEKVAEQTRLADELAWIRTSRREIYDRFLISAQTLQIACEAAGPEAEGAQASVGPAHTAFFGAYGMVLTVADSACVDAARVYAYRLWELKSMVDSPRTSVMEATRENFEEVDQLIRLARQDTIDAIRAELGVGGSARPEKPTKKFNQFRGTKLESKYDAVEQDRPGSAA